MNSDNENEQDAYTFILRGFDGRCHATGTRDRRLIEKFYDAQVDKFLHSSSTFKDEFFKWHNPVTALQKRLRIQNLKRPQDPAKD